MAVLTKPVNQIEKQYTAQDLAKVATTLVGSSAAGALAGYLFNVISPVGGAIFGITLAISNEFLTPLVGQLNVANIVKFALKFFASIAITVALASLFGLALTFKAGIVLTLCMIPTTIVTFSLFRMIQEAK